MFGQNDSSNNSGRGPIALSDDDLVGATGIDWEDLEAQLHDNDGEDDTHDEELQDMASRPLKPMKRSERHLNNNGENDDDYSEFQELSSIPATGRYRDAGGADDDVDNNTVARSKMGRGETALSEPEGDATQRRAKDSPFKLDDADSDLEV
ncbi:hypothetical protein BGZ65_004853 [Modicella reniformis]|uniref:Uncharacterized protein n=1 Tax=Modicella reniformis TaxID=1440133 RepID=A0A9P6LZ58_9FUNG|nr:hypothetical protein BGZ65_004853 [Modicella reniformis]